MQGFKSDEMGFLVGKPIDLTDVHDELGNIHGELSAIKGILSKNSSVALTPGSINKMVQGINAKSALDHKLSSRAVASPMSRQLPNRSLKSNQDKGLDTLSSQVASLEKSSQKSASIATESLGEAIKNHPIATPKSRNAKGQFTKSEDQEGGALRDEKGRFTAGNKSTIAEDKNAVPGKIASVGKSIVSAIGGITPQADEADPSVKAMSEMTGVFSPVGRGLGKLFTNSPGGVSRGQDRWYRRFFKQNAEKARVDDVANKREQQLLKNIEHKQGAESSNSGFLATLFLGFMGVLSSLLMKGLHKLVTPLAFLGTFFAPLLKALQALTRAIGLGKLAEKIGSPGTKTRGSPGTVARGEKAPSGAKTGAKKVLKKLPWIGALMSAGFLASDLYDINQNDESKEVKTKQVGSAVGSTMGGLGGMAAGGAAGAALGSIVPGIGTVVGGIIGSLLGGLGGDKVGGMLGDKFGDWVNDLRASGFIDNMSRDWEIGVTAMGIMWRDFTNLSSSVWGGMVSGVQAGWNNVTGFTQMMWSGVGDSFTSTTDFLKSNWTVVTAIVGGALNSVWGSLGSMATAISDNIKAYTGLDLAKNFGDLKTTVSGWVEGLKTTVSGVSTSLKSSLSDWASGLFNGYFGGVFNQASNLVDNSNEAASTSKEQDANQTAVLNGFMKAGFSKNQAIALTAEVGRENSYNSKNIYGYHKDAANGAVNMGMISWQGDRAKRLQDFMQKKGLIKDGKMVRSQAAIDAQAEFVKQEIDSGQYGDTKKLFEQKNLDPEAYARTLGKDYVKWAYGQNVLSSGKSFDWKKHDNRRRAYMQKAQAKTNVAIPYKPGYVPPAKADNTAKTAETVKPESMTTDAITASTPDAVDPSSVEGMMQTFNSFDGMTKVKEAMFAMLKDASSGKTQPKAHIRTTAAVPAVKVTSAAPIADAPKVDLPLVADSKDSNRAIEDVSRDLSDKRFAHIVTGGYSSPY